jgi:hypothetical protein
MTFFGLVIAIIFALVIFENLEAIARGIFGFAGLVLLIVFLAHVQDAILHH